MLRHLMVTAALVLAAPAVAQMQTPPAPQSGPPATTDPATPPETQTMPAEPATPATPATPADPAATGATAATQSESDIIAAEFPGYDADKSGDLNKAEFSKWMLALRAKSAKPDEKQKSQSELDAWAGAAFTKADTDKNKKVTQAELSAFLTTKS